MRRLSALALATLLMATVPAAIGDPPLFTLSIAGPDVVLEGAQATFEGRWRAALVGYNGYDVRLYVDGERGDWTIPFLGQWSITHTFTTRGVHEVYAVGDEGLPTQTRSPTILVRVAGTPEPALELAAVPVAGELAVDLSWMPPADDGGAPLTSYAIERRGILRVFPHDDSGWVAIATVPATQTSLRDANLGSGWAPLITDYTYRIAAHNGAGASPALEAPVTTHPVGPPAVIATPDTPSRTKITIEADATAGPTQYVAVEQSDDGGATWTTIGASFDTSTTIHRGVFNDATPLYRGVAANIADAIRGEQVAAQGEAPATPTGVRVTVDREIVVHWEAPTEGGPAQRYQVLEDGIVIQSRPHHARNASFVGSPGTHAYTVVARNVVGAGSPSAPATVTLGQASAPEALLGTLIEEDRWARVQLEWAAPLDDGGAPLQGYHIYRRTGSTGAFEKVGATNATTFAFEEGKLSDNTTHSYEVRAHTAVGDGSAATYDAAVSDYQWRLAQTLDRFRICEGPTCTDVPDGGTYTRTQGGAVAYTADLAGLLTRKGTPQEGRDVLVTMWEQGNDEAASSARSTTDDAGEYDAHWRGDTITPTPGCRTIVLVTTADYWPQNPRYEHSFTLCA